jgi:ABC-2 type transport system ATP-binding protein
VTTAAAHPVEIEGLSTRYGEAAVLEDITLTVRAGEIFGLLGLNGAGKTKLVKAVLMLVEPRAGTVRLFGEPHHRPDVRSRLAYLPERFQPPGQLSGYDFIRLTLAFHGRQARRSWIAALAEQLDLDRSALRRPISGYTKSMAQKLGLVAMLSTDRPLLVLNEPMSGLAPKSRHLVKQQLLAYRARGRAILLSSEVPADHDGLCDRIAILHQGRLVEVGAPEDLRARHKAPTLESAFLAAIGRACPLRAS